MKTASSKISYFRKWQLHPSSVSGPNLRNHPWLAFLLRSFTLAVLCLECSFPRSSQCHLLHFPIFSQILSVRPSLNNLFKKVNCLTTVPLLFLCFIILKALAHLRPTYTAFGLFYLFISLLTVSPHQNVSSMDRNFVCFVHCWISNW